AQSKDRIVIGTAVGTTDFTGKACTKTSASWLYDTYALSNVLVKSMIERKLDTWFVLAVDYAFGQSMTNDITKVVEQAGGKVLGALAFVTFTERRRPGSMPQSIPPSNIISKP